MHPMSLTRRSRGPNSGRRTASKATSQGGSAAKKPRTLSRGSFRFQNLTIIAVDSVNLEPLLFDINSNPSNLAHLALRLSVEYRPSLIDPAWVGEDRLHHQLRARRGSPWAPGHHLSLPRRRSVLILMARRRRRLLLRDLRRIIEVKKNYKCSSTSSVRVDLGRGQNR